MSGPPPNVSFRAERRTLVARFTANGKRITRTLVRCAGPVPTAEEGEEAQAALARLLLRAGRAGVRYPAKAGPVRSLGDCIAAYVAHQERNPRCSAPHLKNVKMHLRYLSEFAADASDAPLGTLLISELDAAHLRVYLDTKLATGWSPGYVRHAAVHAKATLRHCRRAELIQRDPWEIVTPPEGGHKESIALTKKAVARLLKAATGRDGDILTLLYETACRPSELARARATDVRGDRIVLAEHKTRRRTGRPRVIFLSPTAQAIVKRYAKKGLLFPNSRGGVLNRVAFGRMVKRAIAALPQKQRAAYADATPYALRHSRATHLIEAGADHKAVADILGDTPLTVLNRYVHPTPEHIRKALR